MAWSQTWRILSLVLALAGGACSPPLLGRSTEVESVFPQTIEADARHAGGRATTPGHGVDAFAYPSPALDSKGRRAFVVGNSIFKQNWVAEGSSVLGRDGLGPRFNARSCSACHARDGRSQPPIAEQDLSSGLLLRIGVAVPGRPDAPHPSYGQQIQDQAILGSQPEASVRVRWRARQGAFDDGDSFELVEPTYSVENLAKGPLGPSVTLGGRVAPQLVGLGLMEGIPTSTLESLADPDDRDGDGISGRLHRIPGRSGSEFGRFGWKATQATVREQVAAAFFNDMGLTSTLFPEGSDSPGDPALVSDSAVPEVSDLALERVVFYCRTLAVPAARQLEEQGRRGRALFHQLRCVSCHVAEFTIGATEATPGVEQQVIRPYTDLLLHDLGPELADGKTDGDARPSEWRTPPLWGLGLIRGVNGHERLLHDGRARGVAEAILWHGGEANSSRQSFLALAAADRTALIAFVRSL